MDDNLVLRALMGAAGASVLAEIDLEKKRQEVEDLRKDRDHWKQARQDAHEAGELMKAEIETLKGAMAADDQRLRDAEERIWPERTLGCDAPDAMADEILHLRQQLAEQQAETVDVRRQRNNETDRLNATNAVSVQQRDEIAYLRTRLDEERSVSAGLRQQLDAANAAVTLQRAGIERLQAFFERVRCEAHEDPELYIPFARLVLQFNAGSIEPAPCQGCERLRAELADEEKCRQLQVAEIERLDAFVSKVRAIVDREYDGREFEDIANALAELDAGTEPTSVAEPAPCPQCERLRAVIDQAWQRIQQSISHADVAGLLAALAEIQSNSSATLTSSPTPVAEPLDAEGGA